MPNITFIRRNIDRFSYLVMLVCLNAGYLLITLLTIFHFLLPRKKNKKDLLLFPYAFMGSDGYIRRFGEYLPHLRKDGIKFEVCNLYDNNKVIAIMNSTASARYMFFARVLWVRIFQVLKARNFKAAFVQRGLFPAYFDLRFPFLERLLRKLNGNITIDFWDSVFVNQPLLVERTVRYADNLSLSNEFLLGQFNAFKGGKYLWKIAVNLDKYLVKTDYTIDGPIRLIWTGLPHNLSYMLNYEPVFRELAKEYRMVLVLVCRESMPIEGLGVEHHLWNEQTFFSLLQSADIGIYPEVDSLHSRGKSTMKVMDYLAAGLPMIGVPYGLPSGIMDGEDMLIAEGLDQWEQALRRLFSDIELRTRLGRNGRQLVVNDFSLESSYQRFLSMVLM